MSSHENITYEKLLDIYRQVKIKEEDLYKFKINEELFVDIRDYILVLGGGVYCLVHRNDPYKNISSFNDKPKFETAHYIVLDNMTAEIAAAWLKQFPFLADKLSNERELKYENNKL